MNTIQMLRDQLKWEHETLESTMADVTEDCAHFSDLGKALPVGAAYAHAVVSEDVIVSTMLANTKPVYENVETGLSEMMPGFDQWENHDTWAKTVKVGLEKFRNYAAKVYEASDKYLASLKEEDLEIEKDLGMMGKRNLFNIISNFLILHSANLSGEISASKGFQGLKGYPF